MQFSTIQSFFSISILALAFFTATPEVAHAGGFNWRTPGRFLAQEFTPVATPEYSTLSIDCYLFLDGNYIDGEWIFVELEQCEGNNLVLNFQRLLPAVERLDYTLSRVDLANNTDTEIISWSVATTNQTTHPSITNHYQITYTLYEDPDPTDIFYSSINEQFPTSLINPECTGSLCWVDIPLVERTSGLYKVTITPVDQNGDLVEHKVSRLFNLNFSYTDLTIF